ncbi:MAG: deoxyribose-phosphate aldolase [Alphaproteobacteria bacterium]|nr:deoxyribose-phosphate aldolase [Alphaproteobacteria bacterium]
MTDIDVSRRALPLLDLTSLNDADDAASTAALCARALTPRGPVAAVCLWPKFVKQAKAALVDTKVRVATVVNFPTGSQPRAEVLAAVRTAIGDGADEIDLVFPYVEWLRGEKVKAATIVAATKAICGPKVPVKVILETGHFTDMAKLAGACAEVIDAGGDMLKTSTGKIATGATPETARVLLEASRKANREIGVKISGGVRTVADARTYLSLADSVRGASWVRPETFRFGASALLDALLAALGEAPAAAAGATGY